MIGILRTIAPDLSEIFGLGWIMFIELISLSYRTPCILDDKPLLVFIIGFGPLCFAKYHFSYSYI